ncbi:MAG: AAA family ATPase [bacterium]|nr:AAA family ATPase [bacterium]
MSTPNILTRLYQTLENAKLPDDLASQIKTKLDLLSTFQNSQFFLEEVYRSQRYLNWVVQIPWHQAGQDNLDITHVKQVLDKHHYGLEATKQRILEYLAVMKLRTAKDNKLTAPVILFTGLVGTGKTTFAYALADALNRPIVRIPFGGLASVFDLRGRSYLHLEAEPGLIIKALIKAKVRNPVILLDEIDRITDKARAEIMGVLVELLDPAQNHSFVDYFIDYPVDLSQVFFIATANNTNNVATAVLNRLEIIQMPSYSDQEKTVIAQKYLVPQAIKQAALPDAVLQIDPSVWPLIIRPIGYEAGVRNLNRIIQGIIRSVALRLVQGEKGPFAITPQNYKQFLPKYLI